MVTCKQQQQQQQQQRQQQQEQQEQQSVRQRIRLREDAIPRHHVLSFTSWTPIGRGPMLLDTQKGHAAPCGSRDGAPRQGPRYRHRSQAWYQAV